MNLLIFAFSCRLVWVVTHWRRARPTPVGLRDAPLRNAALLWCLGRELEDVEARSATMLRIAPDTIEVTWWDGEGSEGRRSYSELEIRDLIGQGRRTRPPEDGLQEFLRTLGRELDRRGVSLTKL